MSVNGIDPNQQIPGADQNPMAARMQQAFTPVAQLFNESPEQLMSELQTGKTSLSDLAQQKGISQDALLGAIKAGMQESAASGKAALSDTQLTNIANRIAHHKHGGHHHRAKGSSSTPGSNDGSTAPSSSDLINTVSRFDQSL